MKTISNVLMAVALLLCVGSLPVAAQDAGSQDYSFGSARANGPVFAVGTTSAGYVWMGGYFNSVNGSAHQSESYVSLTDTYFDLAVLNADGTLDGSFQFPNYSSSFSSYLGGSLDNYYVSAMAVDSNDVVFVAFNNRSGNGSAVIARFDPSGGGGWTLNGGFTLATTNQFTLIYSLAVGDGTVYVAGNYNSAYPGSGGYTGPLVPLNYSGTADLAFTLPPALTAPLFGGSAYIYQVRYLSASAGFTNNSLLVCGNMGIGRISTNGTTVYSSQLFEGGGNFTCAATRPDNLQLSCPDTAGELLAGGESCPYSADAGIDENSQIVGGFHLARYGATADNTLPVLNIPVENYDYELARVDAMPDGSAIVCGYFEEINGAYVDNWAHVLQDGTVDPNFINAVNMWIFDMAAQADGNYIVGGGGLYTEPVFGGVYGYVQRQYGVLAGGALSFVTQPSPTNVVAYPGDFLSITATVSLPYGVDFQWTHDGTNDPGQNSDTLDIDSVAAGDAGTYQLLAATNSLCPQDLDSSNVVLTVLPAPPAPANDLFANAFLLTGTNGMTNGYIRNSTEEPGEPDHANRSDGHSVWYNWTAPGSGFVTITVYNNDFPAALAVYTGAAVDNLTLITNDACSFEEDADQASFPSCDGVSGTVTFFAVGGATYQIAVGGPFEIGSLDTFNLSLTEGISSGDVGPGAGTTWNQVYSDPDDYLDGVAFGCGELVAAGYPNLILNSSNASNWTSVDISLEDASGLNDVSFGKDLFLAGTYGQIAVSSNGSAWNLDNPAVNNNYFYGSIYANGAYVNVGSSGTVMTSPDGADWTVEATNIGTYSYDSLYAVTYGNGLFVAVGDDGTAVTSPNGTNWSLAASSIGYGDTLFSIAFGHGLFVAAGEDGIVTSADGTNWFLQGTNAVGYDALYGVTFGDGRFLAVGTDGTIVLSSDGNWVRDVSGISDLNLNAITYYHPGQYVIVGDNGTILLNQLPTFTSVNNVPNFGLQVTLLGLSGTQAIVQASPSLSPPDWQPILTNIFTNSTIIFTDPPANQARFYRAVVQ